MRFAVFAVFLAACGCAQSVQYPPTGKGWVKLNDAEAARVKALLAHVSDLGEFKANAIEGYHSPTDFPVVIDPVYGTNICNCARAFRLDFTGKWRIRTDWPWCGPRGGIGGGQAVIYLHAGRSIYYRFYHGPINIPGGRPDVTLAATCYNSSGYLGDLQNDPGNPMTAQVSFR
jgi:hypothetical protein